MRLARARVWHSRECFYARRGAKCSSFWRQNAPGPRNSIMRMLRRDSMFYLRRFNRVRGRYCSDSAVVQRVRDSRSWGTVLLIPGFGVISPTRK